MRNVIALCVLALCALFTIPASAACGANGDQFEITFTEEVNFGYCDLYDLEFDPDTFLYEFPLDTPTGCTSSVAPNSCELGGVMSCEVDPNPYSGGRTWWSVAYYGVELVDGGEGTMTITVEDEWSGFICFLEYSAEVAEL